jgi:predicted dehydrogenase
MPSDRAFKVVIIGAGQIGSRYLQGLAQVSTPLNIAVVDTCSKALAIARERFRESSKRVLAHHVEYLNSLVTVSDPVDLAIVSTTSESRRAAIETLLEKCIPSYLVLEKVVFQTTADFEELIPRLKLAGIKSWVNCPRRSLPYFQELRKQFRSLGSIKLEAKASNWGMGSNSIHMLDLFCYLTNCTDLTVDSSGLDWNILASKRSEFIEFSGRLAGANAKGDRFVLVDDINGSERSLIHIKSSGLEIEIDPALGIARHWVNGRAEDSQREVSLPLQSDLTTGLVEKILYEGASTLTTLEDSYAIHRPLLDAFNRHLSLIRNEPVIVCPIT